MARVHKRIATLRTPLALGMSLVVAAHHLGIQRLPTSLHLDSELILYGVVGPAVAWVLLGWLASSVETAERESEAHVRRNHQIEALHSATRLLAGARRVEDVARSLVNLAIQLSEARGGALIWYASESGARWAIAEGSLEGSAAVETQTGQGPCPDCGQPRCTLAPGWRCVPVTLGPEVLGLFWLDRPSWDPTTEQSLRALGSEIALAWWGYQAEGRALAALRDLGADFSASDDFGLAARRFLERVLPALGAGAATLYARDERGVRPRLVLGHEVPPPPAFPGAAGGRIVYLPAGRDGVLAIAFPAPFALRGRDQQLLEVVATQVALLFQLGDAASRLVWRERHRIARELHDGLAQDLAALHLTFRRLERLYPELADLGEMVLTIYEKTRQGIEDLQIAPQAEEHPAEFLSRVVTTLARREGLVARFDSPPGLELPAQVVVQLARVLQEALTNAARHGKARRVEVGLNHSGNALRLVIRDDGVGFDPRRLDPKGHHGLAIMRERIEELGGEFWIESAPGRGTTLTARLPLNPVGSGSGR